MVFEYILKQHGLDPSTDLSINQNYDFGSTAAAFSEGNADYTVEFEPGATSLEQKEKAMLSPLSVKTAVMFPTPLIAAKQSFIDEHPDVIQHFTNALQKGMDFVQTHTPEEISKVLTSISGNRSPYHYNNRNKIL